MPYWMTNPEHGTMPLYNAADVEKHKTMGWSLLNEGESPDLPKKNAPPAAAVDEVLETARHEAIVVLNRQLMAESTPPEHVEKRKPGRPPHKAR